jgi:hypothetical protein
VVLLAELAQRIAWLSPSRTDAALAVRLAADLESFAQARE